MSSYAGRFGHSPQESLSKITSGGTLSTLTAAALSAFLFLAVTMLSPCFAFAGEGKLLFSWADPGHDDHGPGAYSAPRAGIYTEYPGIFDIRSFEVRDLGRVVEFTIRLRGPLPKRDNVVGTMPNGWLLTQADIYIDEDHKWGKGYNKTLVGRDVEFTPESAWEKCVLVTPERRTKVEAAMRDKTEALYMIDMMRDVVFPFSHEVNLCELSARVTKKDLGGEPDPSWGYQVLVTAFTQEAGRLTFYNKKVGSARSDVEFGGGSDLFGAPNVMDILVDSSLGSTQEELLSRYYAHPNLALAEYAKIPCVYSKEEMVKHEYELAKLPGRVSRKTRENVVASLMDSPESAEDVQIREVKDVERGEVFEIPIEKTEPAKGGLEKDLEAPVYSTLPAAAKNEPADNKFGSSDAHTADAASSGEPQSDAEVVSEPDAKRTSAVVEETTADESAGGRSGARRKHSSILEPKSKESMELLIDQYKNKDLSKEEYLKRMEARAAEREQNAKQRGSLSSLFARSKRAEPRITAEEAMKDSLITDPKAEKAKAEAAKKALPESLRVVEPAESSVVKVDESSKAEAPANNALSPDEIDAIKTGKETGTTIVKKQTENKSLSIDEMLKGRGEGGTKALCLENMKVILAAAKKYRADFPDDRNISLMDLVREKLLVTAIKCPDGGHYDIRGEDESELYVKCVGSKHGLLK
jgi:hypothetical protein